MTTRRKINKKKLLLAALVIVVVLAVLVWLAWSGVVVWQWTRRPSSFPEPPPEEVTWGQLESHRLTTSDGEQIGAWLVRGKASRGCVLLLHGLGDRRRSMVSLMEFLAGEGFSSMAITFRGHGDSTGQTNDFGYSGRYDVIAAVEFLEAELPDRPIFVVGCSMGAAAALFAAEELGDRVDGYFLDSPYKDLNSEAWKWIQGQLPPVLDRMAYAGLRLWSVVFLPVSADDISPYKHASRIPPEVPVVIVAGSEDPQLRPGEVRAVFEQVQSDGKFVMFEGAGHPVLVTQNPPLCRETLLELISK